MAIHNFPMSQMFKFYTESYMSKKCRLTCLQVPLTDLPLQRELSAHFGGVTVLNNKFAKIMIISTDNLCSVTTSNVNLCVYCSKFVVASKSV